MKPNFIVLGAPKCGTTSLYYYLKQHPEIFLCPKETHFFASGDPLYNDIIINDWNKYQELFRDAGNEKAIGEVAVRYLYSDYAFENIKKYTPDARLMLMLRNPAERAFSHFLMRFRTGGMRSVTNSTIPVPEDIEMGFSDMKRDYIDRSRYGHYLERFFNSFPRENIGVFVLEELERNPSEQMARIFDFLLVDTDYTIDFNQQYNVSTVSDYNPLAVKLRRNKFLRAIRTSKIYRSHVSKVVPRNLLDKVQWRKSASSDKVSQVVELPDHIYKRLMDHFRKDIARLEGLSDKDFSIWDQ